MDRQDFKMIMDCLLTKLDLIKRLKWKISGHTSYRYKIIRKQWKHPSWYYKYQLGSQ